MPAIVPFIPAIIAAGATLGAAKIATNASKKDSSSKSEVGSSLYRNAPTAVDSATSAEANQIAKNKQAQLAKQAVGRRQTILNSPLGEVPGSQNNSGTKSLLGI